MLGREVCADEVLLAHRNAKTMVMEALPGGKTYQNNGQEKRGND